MAMTPHEAARWYAERSIWIFPCHTVLPNGRCSCRSKDPAHKPGKHPRTQHGFKDATTDLAQIDKWWTMWPDANIGIATEATGWSVIDIDAAHGGYESLADLEQEYGKLPDTVRSLTGGGGGHIVLNGSPIIPSGAGIMPGIDTRGIAGYILAPPSNHASGKLYEWEFRPGETPIAKMPEWFHKLAGQASRTQRETLENLDGGGVIPSGVRETYLVSLAGTLRARGSTVEEIYAFISTVYESRCEKVPPLGTSDLQRIANSIGSRPAGGTFVNKGGGVKGKKDSYPTGVTVKPTTFTAADLETMHLPEPRHAIPGLLSEGLGLLAGKPKSGKSWMAMGFCIALSMGGVALGKHPVGDPSDVLYLALEDGPRRLKTRLKIIMQDVPLPERLTFATQWPKFDEGGVEALSSWLDEHPEASLVVIDTLAKIRPRRSNQGNAYDEDYEHLGAIKELADRHHVCILLIHHLRKMVSDDPLDLISGTLAISGAADTILILKRVQSARNVDGQLHLRGRDIEDADLALRFWRDRAIWQSIGDWDETSVSGHRATILDALADGPLNVRDLQAETDIEMGVLDTTVRRMVRTGELLRVDRGMYAKPNKPNNEAETVFGFKNVTESGSSYGGLFGLFGLFDLSLGPDVAETEQKPNTKPNMFGNRNITRDVLGKSNKPNKPNNVLRVRRENWWEDKDDDDEANPPTKPPTQPVQPKVEEKEWS